MPRAKTVELLERAYGAGDALAAVALLEQSMALRQRRVALLRYLQAQHLQAPLERHHYDYVERVAARMSAATLEGLLVEAHKRARRYRKD